MNIPPDGTGIFKVIERHLASRLLLVTYAAYRVPALEAASPGRGSVGSSSA